MRRAPTVASSRRCRGMDLRQPAPRCSARDDATFRLCIGCGGPIGVVKLLRARGGCLGVIKIRAWKAAISPGELLNERRSRDARGTQGTETSQYLEEKKSTETPSVAASERGSAQTGRDTARGCGAGDVGWIVPSRSPLENGTRAGESPVGTGSGPPIRYPSRVGHVKPGLNRRGPSCKAKYAMTTDSEPSRATERWEEPRSGEDTEPETTRLQAVGGR